MPPSDSELIISVQFSRLPGRPQHANWNEAVAILSTVGYRQARMVALALTASHAIDPARTPNPFVDKPEVDTEYNPLLKAVSDKLHGYLTVKNADGSSDKVWSKISKYNPTSYYLYPDHLLQVRFSHADGESFLGQWSREGCTDTLKVLDQDTKRWETVVDEIKEEIRREQYNEYKTAMKSEDPKKLFTFEGYKYHRECVSENSFSVATMGWEDWLKMKKFSDQTQMFVHH